MMEEKKNYWSCSKCRGSAKVKPVYCREKGYQFYQSDLLVSDLVNPAESMCEDHIISFGAQVFSAGSKTSQQQSLLVSQLLTNTQYG